MHESGDVRKLHGAYDFGVEAGSDCKFLARPETNGLARRDIHLLAGARVSANAGFARLHVEDAEAAQFDAVAAPERVFHGVENGLNGLFGLAPRR